VNWLCSRRLPTPATILAEEEPSSPFDTDQSSKLTATPDSEARPSRSREHKPPVSPTPLETPRQQIAMSPLSCTDASYDDGINIRMEEDEGPSRSRENQHAEELVDELNEIFGYPQRSLSSDECVIGLDVDDEKKIESVGENASPKRGRWTTYREDGQSRRAQQGAANLGAVGVDPLAPVLEGEMLETSHPADAESFLVSNGAGRESSARWSDRSGESGQGQSPLRTLTLEATQGCSKISLLSEPGSGRSTGVVNFDDPDPVDLADIRRQDSSSALSVLSETSAKSSSKNSVLRSSISTGSRAVAFTSRRAGSGLASAGSSVVKGSVAATQTLAKGSRVAGNSIREGSKEVSKSIAKGSRVATSAIKKVAKDTSMDKVLESVGETGMKTLKTTTSIASHVVTSAATVVPILANTASGSARDAGFVVFTNLFTTQAALQMVHHPKVRFVLTYP
jgi:hypothetical protein